MTILLTVALKTITVVMSDSRRISGSQVVSDSATKLVHASDNLTFGVAGAEMGTDLAEAILKGPLPRGAIELTKELMAAASLCVRHTMNHVSPETRAGTVATVALLGAGFDDDGSFIVGGAADNTMARPAHQYRRFGRDWQERSVVWGGEDVGAPKQFEQQLQIAAQHLGTEPNEDQALVQAILKAGKATVDWARHRTTTIGGRTQYRVMHRDGRTESGWM